MTRALRFCRCWNMDHATRLLLLVLALLSAGCKKDPPTGWGDQPSVSLTVDEVSCTEVSLRVNNYNITLPGTLTIYRADSIVQTMGLTVEDTLVVDTHLLPARAYRYQATVSSPNAQSSVSSPPLNFSTADTTTHAVVFSTESLGAGGATSILYDVAILSDTPGQEKAVAVGGIVLRDSAGRLDPIDYSLAQWNGQTWSVKRLYYNSDRPIASIRGLWCCRPDSIWLAAGSVFLWDGASSQAQLSFSRLTLPNPDATIDALWGNAGSGLYGVGNAGTIVRYSGGSGWQRLESGTSIDMKDIWGSTNSRTGSTEIVCLASYGAMVPQARMLLGIEGTTVHSLTDVGLPLNLDGLWFDSQGYGYLTGSGLYRKRLPLSSSEAWKVEGIEHESYHTYAVRGTGGNDVFHAGAFGEILHYNGFSYHSYRSVTGLPYGEYLGIAATKRLVIAVGTDGDKAVVAIGRRQ
jgi:hypothetical protein